MLKQESTLIKTGMSGDKGRPFSCVHNSKLVNLFAHKRCAIWHAQIFRIHISILFSCMYPANTEVVFSGAQEKVDNYLSYFGHVWPQKATTNIRHFMCHQHFILIFHNFVFWSYFQSSIGHVSWLLSLMSSATISNFRQPVQLRSLTFDKSTFKYDILYFSSKHIFCSNIWLESSGVYICQSEVSVLSFVPPMQCWNKTMHCVSCCSWIEP